MSSTGFLPGMTNLPKIKKNLTALRKDVERYALLVDDSEIQYLTDLELATLPHGTVFVFDVEAYKNYFLAGFKEVESGKVVLFENTPVSKLDTYKLTWMLFRYCIVGFNSRDFDLPVITAAIKGWNAVALKALSDDIINNGLHPRDVEEKYKLRIPHNINHIDLIEVAPLKASLKTYSARLHARLIQDLPFDPNAELAPEEANIVMRYNLNDLDDNILLLKGLEPQIRLRETMSQEYEQDLRSRSDAQIAEHVIVSEVAKLNGSRPKKPLIKPGTVYKYNVPSFVRYQLPQLQQVLEIVRNADFVIADSGSPEMPKELADLKICINEGVYRIGIGGLHSSETCAAHKADESTLLLDRDVASYYPSIILNLELYPRHMGRSFLNVYRNIVERRLQAKKAKNKVVADSLKITINGSFGKFGNRYSSLYSPDLMLQVTITGQLCLLLLIEWIESAGIPVISANTDGIVIKCPKSRHVDLEAIVAYWEMVTGFQTEETRYSAIYARDVNNYVAVLTEPKDGEIVKVKGEYAEKGSALNSPLSKNPANLICLDAMQALIVGRTPIEQTIRSCNDIRRFVTVRNVQGGGAKDGVYLGKTVRWYYATGEKGTIVYVKNGNKVPKTDGAKPLMALPECLPTDIDYDWYVQETISMLYDVGFLRKARAATLF